MRVTRVRKASKPERISQRRVRPPENEELECNCKRRDADVAISKDIIKYIVFNIWNTVLTADRTTKIGKKALNSDGEGGLGHLDDDEDHDNDEKMGRIQKIQSWNSTANMESPAP